MITLLSKQTLASRNFMAEIKVLTRGKYYLTPFSEAHVEELCASLSAESKHELACLGYSTVTEALEDIIDQSECYVAKSEGGPIICISGLFIGSSIQCPQMFTMFTDEVRTNFQVMARGSKMLVNFFDQTYPSMRMSILSDFTSMLDWAAWLGFAVKGTVTYNKNTYIEFVRCNPKQKDVSHKPSRPVMH